MKCGRGGGALLMRTAPPFRHLLRRRLLPPNPSQGKESEPTALLVGTTHPFPLPLRGEDSAWREGFSSSTTEWGRLGGGVS